VALLSKELATIHTEVPFEVDFSQYTFATRNILNTDTIDYFKNLEFKSLIPFTSSQSSNETLKVKNKEVKDTSELAQIEALIYEI